MKPHPAEPADAYDRDIAEARLGDRVRVIADRALTEILPAADLLVTVESLSATEALVAGVPGGGPAASLEPARSGGERRGTRCRGWRGSAAGPRGAAGGRRRSSRLAEITRSIPADVASGVDGKALDRLMGLVSRMAGLELGSHAIP